MAAPLLIAPGRVSRKLGMVLECVLRTMVSVSDEGRTIVSCPLTTPRQSRLQGAPEVSSSARVFGPRRDGSSRPGVDQPTLVALLARLLVTGETFLAFKLEPTGVVTVIDEDDRVHRLAPDEQLNYDLVSLEHGDRTVDARLETVTE